MSQVCLCVAVEKEGESSSVGTNPSIICTAHVCECVCLCVRVRAKEPKGESRSFRLSGQRVQQILEEEIWIRDVREETWRTHRKWF